METGDDEDVGQAGIAERTGLLRRDGMGLAGDERRGDGAGIARQRGADAGGDDGAHRFDRALPARRTGALGRRHALRGAEREADRTEPVEIGAALEVIGAGHGGRGRRQQHGLEPQPLSRHEPLGVAAQAHAKARRQMRRVEPVDTARRDDDARALGQRINGDEAALYHHGSEAMRQDRRRHPPGLELGGAEAERD